MEVGAAAAPTADTPIRVTAASANVRMADWSAAVFTNALVVPARPCRAGRPLGAQRSHVRRRGGRSSTVVSDQSLPRDTGRGRAGRYFFGPRAGGGAAGRPFSEGAAAVTF